MILALSKAGQRPGQFPAAAVAQWEPGKAAQAARSPSVSGTPARLITLTEPLARLQPKDFLQAHLERKD